MYVAKPESYLLQAWFWCWATSLFSSSFTHSPCTTICLNERPLPKDFQPRNVDRFWNDVRCRNNILDLWLASATDRCAIRVAYFNKLAQEAKTAFEDVSAGVQSFLVSPHDPILAQ